MTECYVCERRIESGQEIVELQSDIIVPSEEIEEKHVIVKIEFFNGQVKPIVLCKNCVVSVVTQNMLEFDDASSTGSFKITR